MLQSVLDMLAGPIGFVIYISGAVLCVAVLVAHCAWKNLVFNDMVVPLALCWPLALALALVIGVLAAPFFLLHHGVVWLRIRRNMRRRRQQCELAKATAQPR